MSYRSKLLLTKPPKQEQELHIYTNPLSNSQLRLLDRTRRTPRPISPNSKWNIVRNNIHKIRSWGGIDPTKVEPQYRDWYIFFQMSRELRRAQEAIKQVENRPDFLPVHYFHLPVNKTKKRTYNVSHLRPSDALYYTGFGREPLVLQPLLYYFTKECAVPYDSIFRTFLSEVCSIVDQEQQRINRVAVLRKIALIMAMIVFIILGLMLFSLVLSVLKTTSDFKKIYGNDPSGGIEWQQPETTFQTTVNSF